MEQFDAHMPLQTVREALTFSANLRLPAGTTAEARTAAVNATMETLGISKIADQLVGNVATGGISPGQRKVT